MKSRIMRRIYIEYVKNLAWRRKETLLFFFFIGLSFMYVSVPSVLHNMPTDNPSHTFNFLESAVVKTEWFIQTIIAALFISTAISGFRFIRNGQLKLPFLYFQQFFFKRNA